MASVGQRDPEAGEIVGTRRLAPDVIDDPYLFYRQLRARAPVWEVPGTALFTVRRVHDRDRQRPADHDDQPPRRLPRQQHG